MGILLLLCCDKIPIDTQNLSCVPFQLVDPDEVDFLLPGMLAQKGLDDLIAFLLTQ